MKSTWVFFLSVDARAYSILSPVSSFHGIYFFLSVRCPLSQPSGKSLRFLGSFTVARFLSVRLSFNF